MPVNVPTSRAALTVVAEFSAHYFLENLAVRSDNSILVTAMNQHELWFVPAQQGAAPETPTLIHNFAHPPTAIVEVMPDVFVVATSEIYAGTGSYLQRVDLRGWKPGDQPRVSDVCTFDDRARALNGGCLVAPDVMLVADSIAGLVWRVDLHEDGTALTPDVWLADVSMTQDLRHPMKPPQPGINGVRYDPRTQCVYYTSTSRKLFMRVGVDPTTHAPSGSPQQVGGGTMADDFCIDEEAGVAYITTHRENTIDRVALAGPVDQPRVIVAGDPLDERLLGPSSGAWGREPGQVGRVAFFTTDGGTTNPLPDGSVRTAKLLRLELLSE
ncbi:hypothetical protein [uncultured Jatrophihabitans sp.]|uniref:hypothetical protein n=1 Tax=uncultured Jatrophihabitans sp. TaxID=1610747 RepID=UPI0035CBE093